MAIGCVHAVREAGLRVPEDVSVVGIDDHEMAEFFDLTTVAQPVHEQGRLAAELLLEAIRGGAALRAEVGHGADPADRPPHDRPATGHLLTCSPPPPQTSRELPCPANWSLLAVPRVGSHRL